MVTLFLGSHRLLITQSCCITRARRAGLTPGLAFDANIFDWIVLNL